MLRNAIKWAVKNSPAVNTIMIAVLVVGIGSLALLRRETFPQFQLEVVIATVAYPGASPEDIEQSICQKIEEAVRSVEGMKKVSSVASEGSGSVICELLADADAQRALNEIRSEIDHIPSMPLDAEDPVVRQITMRSPALRVAVIGGEPENVADEWQLRELTEQLRDEILNLPHVSQVVLMGARPYQIDIEIPEDTLRKYDLTLADVADAIRRENVETPAGSMKTAGGEFLVRGNNKYTRGRDIARLPVVTDRSGVVLSAGDLGTVRDGFEDSAMYNRVDGEQALSLEVQTTSQEDIIQVVDEVKEYVKTRQAELPQGYRLHVWNDASEIVQDRLSMLTRNGISGLILVFIVLSLFLNIRLAFWVALGIPISIFGACAVMLANGDTLNMLTMFAFVMGLGIVVDDAIVVGENIYSHRQMGKSGVKAAIDGTLEVAPSVIASVMTTVIAFMPLFFVTGMMGKFISVMPLAIIAMLIISLFESMIILPCHLRHRPGEDEGGPRRLWQKVVHWFVAPFGVLLVWADAPRRVVNRALEKVIGSYYLPTLRWSLNHSLIVYSLAVTALLLLGGLYKGGFMPVQIAPEIDGDMVSVRVRFPAGTLGHVTDKATADLEKSLREALAEIEAEGRDEGDSPLASLIFRSVGSSSNLQPGGFQNMAEHFGEVWVELKKVENRGDITSEEIINRWRERHNRVRPTVGAESVTFVKPDMMPASNNVEFKVQGGDMRMLQAAVESTKQKLASFDGVYDIEDNDDPGKGEVRIRVKPEAKSLGIRQSELGRTVRAALYGEEVMRLQRGRNEVKLMVRYPPNERVAASFGEIRVRTPDGEEVKLTSVAERDEALGYAAINRVDQQRAITVTADIDTDKTNAEVIAAQIKKHVETPEFKSEFPGVTMAWGGAQEQFRESMVSLMGGTIVCLFAMYLLLTIEFRSYAQPAIILAIIPFGLIGAVLGHLLLGMTLSLFSFFGIVALMGVLANDSIVLIDFINARRRQGMNLREALLSAGQQRFRAVVLTSITTVAGLMPILWETSLQAQVVQPMAAALAYGLMMATVWVLLLVPVMYQSYARHFSGASEAVDFTVHGETDRYEADERTFTFGRSRKVDLAEEIALAKTPSASDDEVTVVGSQTDDDQTENDELVTHPGETSESEPRVPAQLDDAYAQLNEEGSTRSNGRNGSNRPSQHIDASDNGANGEETPGEHHLTERNAADQLDTGIRPERDLDVRPESSESVEPE
ncbi:MAG: efflux RND transporter permease subunit [Pirellulales bacterium]|nr:efflux RND transporter permease subunit [Pirellulales bacterium]